MDDTRIGLSKSKYCKGYQCPKILWMDVHKPWKAANNLSESVMEIGAKVGELAREYFGEYVLVNSEMQGTGFTDIAEMIHQTETLMSEGYGIIAEASFFIEGLFCSVDILRRTLNGYDIVEVKSATHVSDINLEDVAYQYYVLTKAGIHVDRVYIMHIDSSYVRNGKLDLRGLFTLVDCTDQAKERLNSVEVNIQEMRDYAGRDEEPEKDIDLCCDAPFECAYQGYCRRHLPENTIFEVKRLAAKKKYGLYHDGIVSFEDIIRREPPLTPTQMLQVETTYYHKPDKIDKDAIAHFLQTLSYPLYHLDFETYQQAVPEFDGVRPYAQIPFQYSLHIEDEDGGLEHKEFLAKEGTDPRRKLAESLVWDIPAEACVLAYNMSFERRVIKELAEQFDDLSDHLLKIRDNIHDLMIPFQKQYYYTEAMQGSYSIKYVLPALYPDDPALDYHNLEGIHHGGEASAAFANMVNLSQDEIQTVRTNLLKYCGLDTFAMVKVLEKLRKVCE